MKLFKKSALGLAACLLLAGCSFTNKGGDSGKVGTETTYEEFMTEIAKVPASGEHPFISASAKCVDDTPEGKQTVTDTLAWNATTKSWDFTSSGQNYYIKTAIGLTIQNARSFIEDYHEKGKDAHYYLSPISYVVTEESNGMTDTFTYIWNEYGLMTYSQQKRLVQGQTGSLTITIEYEKDSSIDPNPNPNPNPGSDEFNYTGGTPITPEEMIEIAKELSHTYTDCTMHQKVNENGTVTESDIKYTFNGTTWDRVEEGVYEFGPDINNCTINGFVGEYFDDPDPSSTMQCYKNPLTAVGSYENNVYKVAWNTNGTPIIFEGLVYGVTLTLTFRYSQKL